MNKINNNSKRKYLDGFSSPLLFSLFDCKIGFSNASPFQRGVFFHLKFFLFLRKTRQRKSTQYPPRNAFHLHFPSFYSFLPLLGAFLTLLTSFLSNRQTRKRRSFFANSARELFPQLNSSEIKKFQKNIYFPAIYSTFARAKNEISIKEAANF